MFECKNIDQTNTYEPDLSNIEESGKRTFGEGEEFFETATDAIKRLEEKLKDLSEEKIYDKVNMIATLLAFSCESYLKSIYIYENNISEKDIDEIWESFRPRRTDESSYVHDENNERVYVNKEGQRVPQGQGEALKFTGHELDGLVEHLSPDSQTLLELRLRSISPDMTELNTEISMADILKTSKIIMTQEQMTKDEYQSWFDQHRKTFILARYGGQTKTNVNIEFLRHLATQIKAVAEYKLSSKKEELNISKEAIKRLPAELQQLATINENLFSKPLIDMLLEDERKKESFIKLINEGKMKSFSSLTAGIFYKMFKELDEEEISYVSSLATVPEKNNDMSYYKRYLIAGLKPEEIVKLSVEIKRITKHKLDDELTQILEGVLSDYSYKKTFEDNLKHLTKDYYLMNDSFKTNPKYDKYININKNYK